MSHSSNQDRSNCCQAPVTVSGDDTEGTHYYVCSKCKNPCDLFVAAPPIEEPYDDFYEDISVCKSCHCMTHTVAGRCGKCGALKEDQNEQTS